MGRREPLQSVNCDTSRCIGGGCQYHQMANISSGAKCAVTVSQEIRKKYATKRIATAAFRHRLAPGDGSHFSAGAAGTWPGLDELCPAVNTAACIPAAAEPSQRTASYARIRNWPTAAHSPGSGVSLALESPLAPIDCTSSRLCPSRSSVVTPASAVSPCAAVFPRSAHVGSGRFSALEKNVEIGGEPAPAVAEEVSESRVGGIVVNRLGVEMVGQVEAGERQPDGVLGVHADVLGNPRIQR